jgi:hypothetical protein
LKNRTTRAENIQEFERNDFAALYELIIRSNMNVFIGIEEGIKTEQSSLFKSVDLKKNRVGVHIYYEF